MVNTMPESMWSFVFSVSTIEIGLSLFCSIIVFIIVFKSARDEISRKPLMKICGSWRLRGGSYKKIVILPLVDFYYQKFGKNFGIESFFPIYVLSIFY